MMDASPALYVFPSIVPQDVVCAVICFRYDDNLSKFIIRNEFIVVDVSEEAADDEVEEEAAVGKLRLADSFSSLMHSGFYIMTSCTYPRVS